MLYESPLAWMTLSAASFVLREYMKYLELSENEMAEEFFADKDLNNNKKGKRGNAIIIDGIETVQGRSLIKILKYNGYKVRYLKDGKRLSKKLKRCQENRDLIIISDNHGNSRGMLNTPSPTGIIDSLKNRKGRKQVVLLVFHQLNS